MHGDTDTLSAMVEQLRRLQAVLDARGVAMPEAGPLVSLLSSMPSGFTQRRKAMVADLRRALTGSGATLEAERLDRVLGAMGRVPREAFMPEIADFAYLPAPFEIGYGQTISHPQVVAAMSMSSPVNRFTRHRDEYAQAVKAGAIETSRAIIDSALAPDDESRDYPTVANLVGPRQTRDA